ncbi:hypothetical protein QTP70_016297 [Hemibagrus guttatus]|uniref:ribonuclease H n=1 Tax=Hemibagrus guttatus TaxID=175788 RepID=A0AAE0UIK4_9TELE|nr:hypothetical protein QTP70_016297 [Hemibagrus guttatus]
MRLCYHCGASGHQSSCCPERDAPAQVGGSSLFFSLLVPVSLSVSDHCISVPALIDSGAAVKLIDGALVERLGIPKFPCVPSLRITAIDSQPIGEGYLKHQLLEFRVGLFHQERLAFYVTSSPANPVILGFPWLRCHDPQISWRSRELVRWSPACHRCLQNQVPRPCRTSRVRKTSPPPPGHLPQVYAEFWEVFSKERAARLLPHQPWDCAIDLLPNASPPRGWVYPRSLPESKAMEEYIETALAAGHIRPSTSPAAAGFFFVGKKDGGLCPCIDYRGLNAITVPYPYPLPLVPAALEQLRGARMFTKLDLRSAYNLVWIHKGDEWKTAFHTTHGHYEYRVMPFGLTNALAVFQALINGVFQDLLGKWVIAYIDDNLAYSKSPEEHVLHVREVLSRLQRYHLYVKGGLCHDPPGSGPREGVLARFLRLLPGCAPGINTSSRSTERRPPPSRRAERRPPPSSRAERRPLMCSRAERRPQPGWADNPRGEGGRCGRQSPTPMRSREDGEDEEEEEGLIGAILRRRK